MKDWKKMSMPQRVTFIAAVVGIVAGIATVTPFTISGFLKSTQTSTGFVPSPNPTKLNANTPAPARLNEPDESPAITGTPVAGAAVAATEKPKKTAYRKKSTALTSQVANIGDMIVISLDPKICDENDPNRVFYQTISWLILIKVEGREYIVLVDSFLAGKRKDVAECIYWGDIHDALKTKYLDAPDYIKYTEYIKKGGVVTLNANMRVVKYKDGKCADTIEGISSYEAITSLPGIYWSNDALTDLKKYFNITVEFKGQNIVK